MDEENGGRTTVAVWWQDNVIRRDEIISVGTFQLNKEKQLPKSIIICALIINLHCALPAPTRRLDYTLTALIN